MGLIGTYSDFFVFLANFFDLLPVAFKILFVSFVGMPLLFGLLKLFR